MSRTALFVIVLCFFAIGAFILSLPYLFPPASIRECNKIGSDSSYYTECISTVAEIRGEKGLCAHIHDSYYLHDCQQSVKGPDKSAGELTSWTSDNNYSYVNSYYTNDSLKRCAFDGRNRITTYYGDAYTSTYIFTTETMGFLNGCGAILKNASESVCYGDSYGTETCRENIGFAKGLPASQVCGDTGNSYCYGLYAALFNSPSLCMDDDCYRTLAIQENDPSLCEYTGEYEYGCWMYFAFRDKNISLCDGMSGNSTYGNWHYHYYCRAVLLAENGS